MKGNKTFRMMSAMVLISLIASQISGQISLLHPTWLWLLVLVSVMGFQSTYTGFFPASKLLAGKSGTYCSSKLSDSCCQ